MNNKICVFLTTAALLLSGMCTLRGAQSLADIARMEAARRQTIEEQGLEEKILNLSGTDEQKQEAARPQTQSQSSSKTKTQNQGADSSERTRNSLQRYRSGLQKLDKDIRREELALESKQRRLETARHAPPQISRTITGRNPAAETIQRLEADIKDIRAKLKNLRNERADLYDEGRRAGFLPGELEGRIEY